MNDDKLKEFNESQKEAILSPLGENVLISAGAGSGKTKTLSYKVYKLIKDKEVKTSELLVLTFTNKSAFDMKKKIVEQFTKSNDEEDKELAVKILSSHIQTFDSFSLYLVKKYCSVLNVSDTIKVANDNILLTKKREILDEILHDYYANQKERITNSFSKFCFKDDNQIKDLIFYIDNNLNMLLPNKKRNFINDYENNYLSKDFFDKELLSFVTTLKTEILYKLKISYFNLNTIKLIDDPKLMVSAINNDNYYNITKYTSFSDKGSDKIKNHLFTLLETDYKDFFNKIYLLFNEEETRDDFDGRLNRCKKEYKDEHETIYKPLVDYFKDNLYSFVNQIGFDYEKMYQQLYSFKDDIKLIFEIINKLNDELFKYKIQTSSFTFLDIGYMALSLLTDEKYKEYGDEIRNTYKYILVDEYQDTNDIQETFLDNISKNATLFCVGDAKQSIYRFRNSNVKLFIKRKEAYENKIKKGKVITMNWNYRSSFELLNDINSIFDYYMSLNHGGLDYFEEKIVDGKVIYPQKLCHDDNENFIKYRESIKSNDSFYGIGLIQFKNNDNKKDIEFEIKTIIQDIKNKIDSKYQINDNGILRNCKYSDFAILMRTKSKFQDYQDLFREYNIPLNIITEDHLTQINAILLLQSLIKLINLSISKINNKEMEEENIKHLFMSISRSYIYGKDRGYDDTYIHYLLKDNKFYDDQIMKKCSSFALSHKNSPLLIIFIDILKEFEILDRLPSVGDITSNIDKIESFYQIVSDQQSVGQGIEDFVKLFKNISKYKIDLATENNFEMDDAVNLMTTHKSKGLEFPIVYLPLHCNSYTEHKTDNVSPIFSLNEGILLPNFILNENTATFLNAKYKKEDGSTKEDINEHVRINYVAFTRAKEALYIVANEDSETSVNKRLKESLYEILKNVYYYPAINKQYIELLLKLELCDEKYFIEINKMILEFHDLFTSNHSSDLKKDTLEYYKKIYLCKIEDKIKISKEKLLLHFFENYQYTTELNKMKIIARYNYFDYNDYTINKYKNKYPIFTNIDSIFDKLISKQKKDLLDSKKVDDKLLTAFSSVIYSINESFEKINFDHKVIKTFNVSLEKQNNEDENNYKNLNVKINDDEIKYKEKEVKNRASKKFIEDEDLEVLKSIEYGNLLHSYLEHSDLLNKEIPNIENQHDKKLILNAIDKLNSLDLTNTIVRNEYDYYDIEANTTGKIDLLLIHQKRKQISIIDYKTKKIDDKNYIRQVNIYRKNIQKIYKDYTIKMYLFSIIDCNLVEVNKKEY